MRLLFITMCIFCSKGLLSQSNLAKYNLIFKISPTYGYHSNKPTKFPIGYTDASITPLTQNYNMGYDLSVSGLKKIKKHFRIGVSTYISHFGFMESGEELSFWTNDTYEYSINREFTILGIGFESGYSLVNKKLSRLHFNIGVAYELFVSNQGVFLWKEDENNAKYSLNSSLDYSHRLTKHFNLLIGLSTRVGLRKYFSSIDYQPSRFGVNVGFEYLVE